MIPTGMALAVRRVLDVVPVSDVLSSLVLGANVRPFGSSLFIIILYYSLMYSVGCAIDYSLFVVGVVCYHCRRRLLRS